MKYSEENKEFQFLSFRDPLKNKNLGICIIEASNIEVAIIKAHKKKINPGGEVMCWGLTKEEFDFEGLELNRLYKSKELLDIGYKLIGRGHYEAT